MNRVVYIEGSVLVAEHQSGVAKATHSTLLEIARLKSPQKYYIIVPFDLKKKVESLSIGLPVKSIPIHSLFYRLLKKFDMVPPLDIFFGRAVYVFTNYWNTPLLFSKGITYIYDMSFSIHPEFVEKKNQKYLSAHVKRWAKRADKIITISMSVGKEISSITGSNPHKIEVNYLGVDAEHYIKKSNTEIRNALSKYNIVIKDSYLIVVGNIEPRKNLINTVKGYAAIRNMMTKSMPDLVIIGAEGWDNVEIKQVIQTLQHEGYNIHLPTCRVSDDDLPALYSGARALLQLSHYEGFGLTPIEALACGTISVLSDIAVFREIFGASAIYTDQNDTNAIANSLLVALDAMDTSPMVSNFNLDLFTWEHTAQRLDNTVSSLAR